MYITFKQIASNKFLMGDGNNKNHSYIGNVLLFRNVFFQTSSMDYTTTDSPDLTMNELVSCKKNALRQKGTGLRLPYG